MVCCHPSVLVPSGAGRVGGRQHPSGAALCSRESRSSLFSPSPSSSASGLPGAVLPKTMANGPRHLMGGAAVDEA